MILLRAFLILHTLHMFYSQEKQTFYQTLCFCILNLKSAVSKYSPLERVHEYRHSDIRRLQSFIFVQCLHYFSPEVMTNQNVLVPVKVNMKSELIFLFYHSRSCDTIGKKRQTQPPLQAEFKLGRFFF